MDEPWPVDRGIRAGREPLRVLFGGPVDDTAALRARIDELEEHMAATSEQWDGYVLFLHAPAGFSIVECNDRSPPLGQVLLLPEGSYVVAAIRPSPFPGDDRPCLVAEPA